jgi:uncharacterized repeat protein (TIGR03803 family)
VPNVRASRVVGFFSAGARKYRVAWFACMTVLLCACGGGGGSSDTPAPSRFTVGGTVVGLTTGSSVTLLNNGTDSLSVSSSSPFTFPTQIAAGNTYAVSLGGQPIGHQCAVTSASGIVQAAVTNVRIECVALSYSIGGTLSGLLPGETVTVNNNGTDSLTIDSNAPFTFATKAAFGSHYDVSISDEPQGYVCTVTGGAGTVDGADVTNVQVGCVEKRYTIGGTVTGLENGRSFELLNNGGDALNVTSNGAFVFATGLTDGSPYSVTARSPLPDQNCMVSAGSGTVAASNVSSVVVQCVYLRTMYSFGTGPLDGSGPESGVVFGSDGNLYGTTVSGGINVINTANNIGAGTFFKLTPAGTQTVLWHFGTGQDGQNPTGDLAVDSNGIFYGMTHRGGIHGAGTLFKMTSAGQGTVLWNFGAGNDGRNPFGNVVVGQDGNLYGTTSAGGTNGFGIVFRVTPAGVRTVLWNFGAGADGQTPKGRLVQASDGNFYGTTEAGGAFGFGIVFKVTPAGVEQVLHSFANVDGQGPEGVTLGPNGDLFGVTIGGGAYSAGTAFKVTTSGAHTVLWNFGDGNDGRNPPVTLLHAADGNFYGSTAGGGTSGRGVIFRLTPAGVETVIWRFNETDGSTPFSTLMQGPDGAIYGTTYRGGTGTSGYGGSVFKLTM